MASDDTPDPKQILKLARQLMDSAARRKKYRAIDFMGESFWYPSQPAFFRAGSSGVHQRMLYSGNQIGKTTAGCFEDVMHTGLYVPWWDGLRFKKPIFAWAASPSLIVGRDTLQRKLVGPLEDFGAGGMVPLEYVVKKPIMVSGGMSAIDTLFIQRHDAEGNPDGVSQLVFRSYEQGIQKLAGATVDWIHCDEPPPRLVMCITNF
jgi:hypothetical protein